MLPSIYVSLMAAGNINNSAIFFQSPITIVFHPDYESAGSANELLPWLLILETNKKTTIRRDQRSKTTSSLDQIASVRIEQIGKVSCVVQVTMRIPEVDDLELIQIRNHLNAEIFRVQYSGTVQSIFLN